MIQNDKILLITGGTSEIALELVREIAPNFKRIYLHYRDNANIFDELKNRYENIIFPVKADFSSYESTVNMIEKIQNSNYIPNSILHLAAPKARNLQFHKFKWEDYQNELDISFRSILLILEAFVPFMRKQRYGRIVFMLTSYILGGIPPKFQSPYITTKFALYGLMRNLASEYAERGITVNAISPDMIETKFLSNITPLIISQNAEKNPLGRNIKVSDLVPVLRYLLSEASEAITGQNIGITGGGEII